MNSLLPVEQDTGPLSFTMAGQTMAKSLYSVMITLSFLSEPRAICPFSENLVINSMKKLDFLKIIPSQAFLHLYCPTLGTQKFI